MSVLEHDYEPVRGLPGHLPAGEEVLWQGAPAWRALARRAFHVDKVALYFALLLAWRAGVVLVEGRPLGEIAAAALWLGPMALVACGILAVLAWLNARMTIYTVTNRRVVVKFGVALPMTVNLPFALIRDVALKLYGDGTGDLALKLGGEERVSYFHLWPNVRRWHITNPQPMLRVIPGAAEVGAQLRAALDSFDHSETDHTEADDARRAGETAATASAASGVQQLAAAG